MTRYVEVATYPSRRDPLLVYHVSMDEAGEFSCTCPGWTYKREGRERYCRHVQEWLMTAPVSTLQAAVVAVGRRPREAAQVAETVVAARATLAGASDLRRRGIRWD